MVKDYMKKQIVVQAMVWTGGNAEELEDFIGHVCIGQDFYFDEDRNLFITTLEGDHRADIGDYIIKGVKGEFYPCKPDIFEMSYEEVEKCEGLPANDEWKRNRDYADCLKAITNNPAEIGFRLPQWSPDVVIKLQLPDENSKMTAPYLYVESRYGRVPWIETNIEKFSQKWEIVTFGSLAE